MPLDAKDRDVLRNLAGQWAEIAALPVQRSTVAAWKALNGLKPVRPMPIFYQVCWHEMDVNGELALQCGDPFCRGLETRIRRTLYPWRHMRGDMVVEPCIEVGKAIRRLGFGVGVTEQTAVTDPRNSVVSHHDEAQGLLGS